MFHFISFITVFHHQYFNRTLKDQHSDVVDGNLITMNAILTTINEWCVKKTYEKHTKNINAKIKINKVFSEFKREFCSTILVFLFKILVVKKRFYYCKFQIQAFSFLFKWNFCEFQGCYDNIPKQNHTHNEL